ncbi:MAG TPA: hypothetical protein VIJ52_02790 [Pseudolabrys sp.]
MSIESDIRQAELEIRAWLGPNTASHERTIGLLEAYQVRTPEQKEAFVAALIGRLLICGAFSNAKNASPSADS